MSYFSGDFTYRPVSLISGHFGGSRLSGIREFINPSNYNSCYFNSFYSPLGRYNGPRGGPLFRNYNTY